MGAVFAGVIRAPITSVLIIFEMTGSYGLILPLMIANMTAYAIARRFRPAPIYEALLEQDNIFLPSRTRTPTHALEQIKVADAMKTDVITLSPKMSVAQALNHAQQYELTTFPVVDEANVCVGVITELRLRRTLAAGGGGTAVGTIADRCQSVHPDQLLNRAVFRMDRAGVRQLAVVERGDGRHFTGIITMTDIIRAQAKAIEATGVTDSKPAS
jgi:CIC family chloride channel protein